LTMARAERQSRHRRDSPTHKRRSAGVNLGRFFADRYSTPTWWRRAKFSSSSIARERNIEDRVPRSVVRRMSIGGEFRIESIIPIRSDSSRFSRGTVDTDALIFSSKRGTPLCRRNLLNRQVLPLCKELKIPRTTWHPLRHACATLLDVVGTPRGTVTALVGHSSARMTEHYVHSVDAVARQAVQKVEDLLTGPKRTQIEEIRNLGSTLIQ
jgi:hypothetical protein